jgi:hypothetical protein
VFYISVAIIYRDVAHVATYVSSVCSDYFICFILQIFYLDGCIYMHGCKIMFLSIFNCFKRMFQVFHLDVANILQWLHTCFSWCFRSMLQWFHPDVAKVDLVLRHML